MSQPTDPEPLPGLTRAVGVFHALFGLVLLLAGLGVASIFVPFLLAHNPLQFDPAFTQEVVRDVRRELVEQVRLKEAAAADPAEKARLAKTRLDLEATPARIGNQVDFARINADLPRVESLLWFDLISGPVLNLLMVVAGGGLAGLTRWGRRLSLWVAALKVARLVVLSGGLAFVVVPAVTHLVGQFVRADFGPAFLRGAIAQSAGGGGGLVVPPPRLSPDDFLRVLASCGYLYAVLVLALGAIWPAIVLVVLTRPGARTACESPTADPPPTPTHGATAPG